LVGTLRSIRTNDLQYKLFTGFSERVGIAWSAKRKRKELGDRSIHCGRNKGKIKPLGGHLSVNHLGTLRKEKGVKPSRWSTTTFYRSQPSPLTAEGVGRSSVRISRPRSKGTPSMSSRQAKRSLAYAWGHKGTTGSGAITDVGSIILTTGET